MKEALNRMLAAARQMEASDIHLKVGLRPVFRIQGELRRVKDAPVVSQEVLHAFATSLMNPLQRGSFEQKREVDLAYSAPDGTRCRVSVFQQKGMTGMVLRIIPPTVPPFESLNLPDVILKLAQSPRGLFLVTGVTGSGKSTTLAALVDRIAQQRSCHILTIEDPIEYIFRDQAAVINQRELGLDTLSFPEALRAALRQDPDVVMVGEMRDLDTIEIAMVAAETGHLVLSTLHTLDAVETVNRIITVFPPHQQNQIRIQLATVLVGAVSQRLVTRADGKGLIPAVEVMVANQRIRELIKDPQRTVEIREAISNGRHPYGMMSFDQSLTELVQSNRITYEEALSNATNADDFALRFKGIAEASSNDQAAWMPHGKFQPGQIPLDGLMLDREGRKR